MNNLHARSAPVHPPSQVARRDPAAPSVTVVPASNWKKQRLPSQERRFPVGVVVTDPPTPVTRSPSITVARGAASAPEIITERQIRSEARRQRRMGLQRRSELHGYSQEAPSQAADLAASQARSPASVRTDQPVTRLIESGGGRREERREPRAPSPACRVRLPGGRDNVTAQSPRASASTTDRPARGCTAARSDRSQGTKAHTGSGRLPLSRG
jgi:hypothetical protein